MKQKEKVIKVSQGQNFNYDLQKLNEFLKDGYSVKNVVTLENASNYYGGALYTIKLIENK